MNEDLVLLDAYSMENIRIIWCSHAHTLVHSRKMLGISVIVMLSLFFGGMNAHLVLANFCSLITNLLEQASLKHNFVFLFSKYLHKLLCNKKWTVMIEWSE